MFSRDDLLHKLEPITSFRDFASDQIKIQEFGHTDFTSPSSEQMILIHRGSKTDFANALEFWLASLFSQDWRNDYALPYARKGLCLEMDRAEFEAFVNEYSSSCLSPLEPPFAKSFRAGLKMYNDWNDVAALAELEDGFVAFYWSTTA